MNQRSQLRRALPLIAAVSALISFAAEAGYTIRVPYPVAVGATPNYRLSFLGDADAEGSLIRLGTTDGQETVTKTTVLKNTGRLPLNVTLSRENHISGTGAVYTGISTPVVSGDIQLNPGETFDIPWTIRTRPSHDGYQSGQEWAILAFNLSFPGSTLSNRRIEAKASGRPKLYTLNVANYFAVSGLSYWVGPASNSGYQVELSVHPWSVGEWNGVILTGDATMTATGAVYMLDPVRTTCPIGTGVASVCTAVVNVTPPEAATRGATTGNGTLQLGIVPGHTPAQLVSIPGVRGMPTSDVVVLGPTAISFPSTAIGSSSSSPQAGPYEYKSGYQNYYAPNPTGSTGQATILRLPVSYDGEYGSSYAVSGWTITGPHAADFTVAPTYPGCTGTGTQGTRARALSTTQIYYSPTGQYAYCDLAVTFTPTGAGMRNATLSVNFRSPSKPYELILGASPLQVPLTGFGAP